MVWVLECSCCHCHLVLLIPLPLLSLAPNFAAAPDPAVASDPTPLLPPTRAGLAVACACSAYSGAATWTGPLSTACTCSRSHQSCCSCWPVHAHSHLYRSLHPGPIICPCSCWPHNDVIVVAWLCTLRIVFVMGTAKPMGIRSRVVQVQVR